MAKKGVEDASTPGAEEPQVGKGRPTPSRKQAEAANARPVVGSKDKTQLKAQRQVMNSQRERARVGMMQGEEKYLGPRDKGPQRRYVREYVDARWNVGEMLIPMMLVVLVMTFIPQIQVVSLLVIWIFVGLAVLDAVFLGFRLKKKLAERFGDDRIQPGFRWYAAMRAFQFRPLRAPKALNKRGEFPA